MAMRLVAFIPSPLHLLTMTTPGPLSSSKPADVPTSATAALQSAAPPSPTSPTTSSTCTATFSSSAPQLPALINIEDYHQHARRYLPKQVYDYYSSGAHDQQTLLDNVAAYRRLLLRPRFLIDVSRMDTSVSVLGERMRSPICVAPTAMQRMAHPDGELATVRACAKRGVLMTLSSLSTTSLEDVAAAAQAALSHSHSSAASVNPSSSSSSPSSPPSSSPSRSSSLPPPHLWYQLYVYKDRSITTDLIRRAEAAGYKAIVLTIDTPQFGVRESDVHNRFTLPPHLQLANFTEGRGRSMTAGGSTGTASGSSGSNLAAYSSSMFDATVSWKDIAWLRSITRLSLIVKGVLTAEDAELACEQCVDAIIVSNHGARQLDSVSATIDALPEVAAIIQQRGQGRVELYVDGGIRRGSDVFKAMALGARAVFIGRPVLWGLSYGGEVGVEQVLHILQTELELCMALCGCPDIGSIERSRVTTRQTLWRKAKL